MLFHWWKPKYNAKVCVSMTSKKKKLMKICNNLKEISYITEDEENWK